MYIKSHILPMVTLVFSFHCVISRQIFVIERFICDSSCSLIQLVHRFCNYMHDPPIVQKLQEQSMYQWGVTMISEV